MLHQTFSPFRSAKCFDFDKKVSQQIYVMSNVLWCIHHQSMLKALILCVPSPKSDKDVKMADDKEDCS